MPVHEAEQIVTALEDRGREVVYLRYEDEGHGLVRLANRIDAYPQVAAFLQRMLLPWNATGPPGARRGHRTGVAGMGRSGRAE